MSKRLVDRVLYQLHKLQGGAYIVDEPKILGAVSCTGPVNSSIFTSTGRTVCIIST